MQTEWKAKTAKYSSYFYAVSPQVLESHLFDCLCNDQD